MADENKREFSEEQLRAHEGQLNLQMGFNKGASQSGHGGFGNTRHMWKTNENCYTFFTCMTCIHVGVTVNVRSIKFYIYIWNKEYVSVSKYT